LNIGSMGLEPLQALMLGKAVTLWGHSLVSFIGKKISDWNQNQH